MHHSINHRLVGGLGWNLSEPSTANSGITGSRLSRCGFCNYLSCASLAVLNRPLPSIDRPCSASSVFLLARQNGADSDPPPRLLIFAGEPPVRLAVSLSLNHFGQNIEPELSLKACCIPSHYFHHYVRSPISCLPPPPSPDPISSIPFLQPLSVEGKTGLRKC